MNQVEQDFHDRYGKEILTIAAAIPVMAEEKNLEHLFLLVQSCYLMQKQASLIIEAIERENQDTSLPSGWRFDFSATG